MATMNFSGDFPMCQGDSFVGCCEKMKKLLIVMHRVINKCTSHNLYIHDDNGNVVVLANYIRPSSIMDPELQMSFLKFFGSRNMFLANP